MKALICADQWTMQSAVVRQRRLGGDAWEGYAQGTLEHRRGDASRSKYELALGVAPVNQDTQTPLS
jgi:hypothetical protein